MARIQFLNDYAVVWFSFENSELFGIRVSYEDYSIDELLFLDHAGRLEDLL